MSGENPLEAAAPLPAAARVPVMDDGPVLLSGSNPLVAAANPLLNLIPQLRAAVQHSDPTQIRDYLVREVQAFETRARALGVSAETILGARYCLCTALDETAAQTPWGGSGVWSRHSLLVTFHNETWGGEKFFQLLAKLAQNPQQHAHLLELMYYCLALGFEGRFRIVDNGRTQLETLKQRLLTIIHQVRGEYERPLAMHWQPARDAAQAQLGDDAAVGRRVARAPDRGQHVPVVHVLARQHDGRALRHHQRHPRAAHDDHEAARRQAGVREVPRARDQAKASSR